MSPNLQRAEITRKAVIYRIPGMENATVRRDVEYHAAPAGRLTMDIYYPPDAPKGERIPAVIFVLGFSDAGAEAKLGCKFKEMASYTSWAQLVAASGMAAITYSNREPAAHLLALLSYLHQNAGPLGIDATRLGVWACSGNVPLALWLLMQERPTLLRCAALCYGYMLDLGGSASVAEASQQWGFANPCAGKSLADLPDVPLFLVRAGGDQMPHLNTSMDAFVTAGLAGNLPITLANHPSAPHAFDLLDEGQASRGVIRQVLGFLQFHLLTQRRPRGWR